MLTTEEQVIVALRGIIRAADIHSHRLQREFGLTGPQLSILRVISRLSPVTTGSLADAAGFSRATLTGILDRLERQKLINRTRDPGDRRSVIVSITAAGQKILARAPSLLQKHFSSELAQMPPPERAQLLKTLQCVARLMQADSLEEAGRPAGR